jgi:hypothetical protein
MDKRPYRTVTFAEPTLLCVLPASFFETSPFGTGLGNLSKA